MSEDRAKDTQIEAPPVAGADHSLGVELISQTDTWRNSLIRRIPPHICSIRTLTRDLNETGIQVHQTAEVLAIDHFWEVKLIPDPKVQCQVRGCPIRILCEEKDPLLELFS